MIRYATPVGTINYLENDTFVLKAKYVDNHAAMYVESIICYNKTYDLIEWDRVRMFIDGTLTVEW